MNMVANSSFHARDYVFGPPLPGCLLVTTGSADGSSGGPNISFYTPGLRSACQTSGLGSACSVSTAETVPLHRFRFAIVSSAGFALIWPVRPFCFVLARL